MGRGRAMKLRQRLLPEATQVFLRRRSVESIGLVLILVAAVLGAALATYNPGDPSLNRAAAIAPRNLLGLPGAYVADLLLQTFGAASGLIVVTLAAWAWRIGSHRGLPWWWLNLSLTPFTLLVGSVMAAGLPVPSRWPLDTGLGGAVGDVFLHLKLSPVLADAGVPAAPLVIALIAGLVTLMLLPLTLGLSFSEWRGMSRAAAVPARGLYRGSQTLRRDAAPRGTDLDDEDQVDRPVTAGRREPALAAGARPAQPAAAEAPRGTPMVAPKVERRADRPKPGRRIQEEAQVELDLGETTDQFMLPPLGLLTTPPPDRGADRVNEEALEQNARLLKSTLEEFGVYGEIVKVRPGPVVTLYELEPAPGTKSSRVIGLADDIARSMSALSARIAVIPGRNAIGIELPNAKREGVLLREILQSAEYEATEGRLALALGKDIAGAPVIADLARMPHLLVAGTTGSGKSVAINTMILSLLYRLPPEECRFIMVDPKMLELSVYDGIPHLLAPVVTDPGKAVVALKWTVREMEERYRKMSELGVRNIAGFNQKVAEIHAKADKKSRTVQTGFDPESGQPIFEERPLELQPLPFIVVVVDELADLMLVAGKDIEAAIQRLAQMARAAGIHLIMATQRPSVDVITGTIKANFPTRISFQVTSKIDSRTILGEQGAEQLLGQGDMLYMPGAGRITRVHGPFVSDAEVEKVVAHLKAQGEPEYLESITVEARNDGLLSLGGADSGGGSAEDALYDRAVALVCRERKASTSFVQRHLQIGYNRAARIIERMEAEGVVGPANHVGKREVLARDIEEVD